jgi:phospholipid transport system substrate-binding protein
MSSTVKRLGTHLGALGIACAPLWAAADGARDVVEQFHGELSGLIEAADRLDSDARHARVESAVSGSHDFAALARSSLGAAWEELDEEDRARYVDDFGQDCVAYYAAHLADYGAGRFTIAAEEPKANGVSVTAIPAGSGEANSIVYTLGRVDAAWLITGIDQGGIDLFGGLHAVARRLESPRSVVQRLQAELLEVMKASDTLGYAGRHVRLAPVLEDTHDFASIARLSFSRRTWKAFEEVEQDQIVDHIRRLGYATYAGRFDGYNKEAFAVTGEDSIKGGEVVTTELVKSDGAKVELKYLLSRSGGEWQIVNIIADGVSDLATKQAEYASILERKGLGKLLSTLQNQIEGFEVQ